MKCIFRIIALALAATALPAFALPVQLELVVHDQPEVKVDKIERQRPVFNPVSTERGVEMQRVGLDLVCWARNIRLDDKPVFEIYHEGKYIDRLPIARPDLQPGKHMLWPGDHAFTVGADGSIKTDDSELIVDGATVRIKCYPVTIRAFRANPEETDLPMSMRTASLPNMTVRESANAEKNAPKTPDEKDGSIDLLPVFDSFAPLTIYLPANTVGKGYLIHPAGLTFHLTPQGVTAAQGVTGLRIEKGLIEIPLYGFPVFGSPHTNLVVTAVEQLGAGSLTNWYPRHEPYELKLANHAKSIFVDGDVSALPVKSIRLDIGDPVALTQRGLIVEMPGRLLTPGQKLEVRINAVDAGPAMLAERAAKAATGKPEADDLKKKAAEASALNPLGDAKPFAQVQAYGGSTWADVVITAGAEGRATIDVPAIADGLYQLRIGVRPSDPAQQPISVDQLVTIAAEHPFSIGLFTPRGRNAFYRGEPFWFGLTLLGGKQPIAAGTDVNIELVDEAGKVIPLHHAPLKNAVAAGGYDTMILRLNGSESLTLAAGKYTLCAKVGDAAAKPVSLEMVETEQRTHFTNLLNGKYNALGAGNSPMSYESVLGTGEHAEDLAREITAMGYNAFTGMTYGQNRVIRHGAQLEQLVRDTPALGPWESYYLPSGRDRFLNAAVRNNLRFYEDIFTYHDTMLPRDPMILVACERYIGLETMSLRSSPAFRGDCLYDEIYDTADTGTEMSQMFLKAQEFSYRDKNNGQTSADALKAMDRFSARPFGQRRPEDLVKFRTWAAHQDADWRIFSDRMAVVVKSIMPDSQNTTQQRFFGHNGGNIDVTGMATDVFKSLDAAMCVMYKDAGSGERPVFAPMQADVLRVRDDLPVWTQLHHYNASGLFGAHLLRQAFFALSQKIEGLTFFTINHDPSSPSPDDSRETIRNIAGQLCTSYGDFFNTAQRGYKQVAVFYLRQAQQVGARKPNRLVMQAEGLWVACMRAGFPADFLYDDQIIAGKGSEYSVIFVPGYYYEDEATPEVLTALKKLADSGKILVIERSSKLPIEKAVRLDSELDEYDGKLGGAFPRYTDFETEMVWDQSEQMTKLLRDFLPKYILPAAQHNLIVGPDWLRSGQGQYMVLPNFAPTHFTGLYKTLYQAPDRPTLRFPKRPGFAYDMLEMKRVEVTEDGDWMTLRADMRDYPGKIYAFLPAAIDKVSLRVGGAVKAGTALQYAVEVQDSAGKAIDAGFPIEIRLTDSSGKVIQEIYRAAIPAYAGVYIIPGSTAAGAWKLTVRELISGAIATADIQISAGSPPTAVVDERSVWLYDAGHVRSFLAAKQPVLIALDDDQTWCAAAEKLRLALVAGGCEAKVVRVSEAMHMSADWSEKAPKPDGTRLWRGELVEPGLFIDAPIVLIGKRYENRLIEALIRRDLLEQPLTTHFPAPGRALVGWTPRAFSPQFDTIWILGNDEAGINRGIEALVGSAMPEGVNARPVVLAPVVDPKASLTTAGVSQSAQPSSFGDVISGQDWVRSLNIDAATGRTLVGTFGYGDNLFCFDAAGKLLWKQFLPEHHVYLARWYDGGKRIVAATARGYSVFLLDGETGKVVKKFGATEWPHGHGSYEGSTESEAQIQINEPLRQILVGGLSGILAVDFDGNKQWLYDRAEAIASYPKEAEQTSAAEFGKSAVLGNFALSPDGSKLAVSEEIIAGSTPSRTPGEILSLWRHVPRVIDARTGKVLLENNEDPGNRTSPGSWGVNWPADSVVPFVRTENVIAPFGADGKLGAFTTTTGNHLADGGAIVSSATGVVRYDAKGQTLWTMGDGQIFIPALDALSADIARYYRSSRDGLIRCIDMKDGKVLWETRVPFQARLNPVGDGVMAGTSNGTVARLDMAGKIIWSQRLRDLHVLPDVPYADYLAAAKARDLKVAASYYPSGVDTPGDYDSTFRFGIEQLAHGDFESAEGWSSANGGVTIAAPAHAGASALQLASGQLVTQRVARRLIPSGTYLLEFQYQVESEKAAVVGGGVLSNGKTETFTATRFTGMPGQWHFARVAIKTMADTTTLDIGFEASGGLVRIDDVSLRPIRFPSPNLLANAELHAIEPTFVKDIRVQYDRIPSPLRQKLQQRNRVVAFRQGAANTAVIWTQEEAFLHNGRLDDVGENWGYQPDNMGFSAVLTKPAYVSHVVLYLNNATPENVYGTISLLVNDLDTKLPKEVALVRGNERRFVVAKFDPPIRTDLIKVLPGYHRAHKECLTEVEIYGPLGGPEIAAKVKSLSGDPDATAMLMGNSSHVPTTLPADLTGDYIEAARQQISGAYYSGMTVADGAVACPDAEGIIRSFALPKPDGKGRPLEPGVNWSLAGVTPTSTPARYAGRLLAGSADGKLYAIGDDGTPLWSFLTGGRVYSSPSPDKDDVYVGSDDGRLYKLDIDSGTLIWEFVAGGMIRSGPALGEGRAYFTSDNGFIYAVDLNTGILAWKSPVAAYSRSSPSLHKGRVYVGDEQGKAHCFDATSGSPIWSADVGGYISSCPIVTDGGIVFISEQGDAVMLSDSGAVLWKRSLGSRVQGQPVATQTQLIVPTHEGLQVLRRADGQPDARFVPPPVEKLGNVISALKYGDHLLLYTANFGVIENQGKSFTQFGSQVIVWTPKPPAKEKK